MSFAAALSKRALRSLSNGAPQRRFSSHGGLGCKEGLSHGGLQKGILPSSIPACQRDELDDAARPLSTAAEAFAELVTTLSGDDAADRNVMNCP